jgi:hypothetical protein
MNFKMKKMFLSIVMCLLANVYVQVEKAVGSYSLSYFNKSYEIEASEIKNGKFTVYIQVSNVQKTSWSFKLI